MRESAAGWDALDGSLREMFGRPSDRVDGLDERVRNEDWMPLYEGASGVWNRVAPRAADAEQAPASRP